MYDQASFSMNMEQVKAYSVLFITLRFIEVGCCYGGVINMLQHPPLPRDLRVSMRVRVSMCVSVCACMCGCV